MHGCATLHRIIGSFTFAALVSLATTTTAQQVIPIHPVSGGGGTTPATSAPRTGVLRGAKIVTPSSSIALAADLGKKAHTNFLVLNPGTANPLEAPPYGGYAYETPTSLACVYQLVSTLPAGCNPNTVTTVITGGSKDIAIVDAYDDPEAAPDLAYFSAQFGLPFSVSKFETVYTGGVQPSTDYTGGWELEESLDIEYAHAMAPGATIHLVEAYDNSFTSLFAAVTEATNIIQCKNYTTTVNACASVTGAGEVSMSWGGGEFSGETAYDTYFNQTNVVFFASSGDAPGAIYPSTSPNVVSVGGTTIRRFASGATSGNYIGETAWPDGGSGPSAYEPIPAYQSGNATVKATWGTTRGTPDVSAVANPYTGVWVYDSFPNSFDWTTVGWWIVGGTSAASPIWTGVVNRAGSFAASSNAELTKLYSDLAPAATYAADFHDEWNGFCYYYMSLSAATGYDGCTGIGSPVGYGGK